MKVRNKGKRKQNHCNGWNVCWMCIWKTVQQVDVVVVVVVAMAVLLVLVEQIEFPAAGVTMRLHRSLFATLPALPPFASFSQQKFLFFSSVSCTSAAVRFNQLSNKLLVVGFVRWLRMDFLGIILHLGTSIISFWVVALVVVVFAIFLFRSIDWRAHEMCQSKPLKCASNFQYASE